MTKALKFVGETPKHKVIRRLMVAIPFSVPILIFSVPLLMTGNNISFGDADYLIQAQEAMRISILKFHQFPWWNPWVSGGVPLFANPQFGLFSIITPFSILFGAALGYKLAIVAYLLIGFWGMRALLTRVFYTPDFTAVLLSYIWTFGTFLSARVMLGHFTFLTVQFFPWSLLFFMRRHEDNWAWLKFGIVTSLMALTAAHNTTIMAYFVLGLIFLFGCLSLAFERKNKVLLGQIAITSKDLHFWLKSGLVFLVLTSYRLYLTLQYVRDFPRPNSGLEEQSLGILKGFFAIFGPLKQFADTPKLPQVGWSWHEATAYIGISTLVVFITVLALVFRSLKKTGTKKYFSKYTYILLGIIIVCFLLGLGDFIGKLSPYSLLRDLPIFSSMRVAPRWFAWCALFILLFIGSYTGKKLRPLINILLAISTVELFLFSMPNIAKPYTVSTQQTRPQTSVFEQKKQYNTYRNNVPYDDNFTGATLDNYGQIIAGDALVDTRFPPPVGVITKRCSADSGCSLLLSNNASVSHWSPNRIVINRKTNDTKPIELNMNPGSCWVANGKYINPSEKETNPSAIFVIGDSSPKIELKCIPKFSPIWLLNKVF